MIEICSSKPFCKDAHQSIVDGDSTSSGAILVDDINTAGLLNLPGGVMLSTAYQSNVI